MWQFTIDGKSARLDDLPGNLVGKVARKHGLSWFDLVITPARDEEAFVDLVRAVSAHLGAEMPAHATVADVLALTDCIERVEEDRPSTYDESGLPLADGPTTG